MTISTGTIIGRGDLKGSILRAVLLVLALSISYGLCIFACSAFEIEVPSRFLLAMFLVVLFSMVVGLFLSEYPQGDDYALMRIGFATFCRTGLPLLVVLLVARYSDPSFTSKTMMAFLIVFYAVGLLTSIGLSLYRFADTSSSSKTHEVDSAAA